jgi:hypothetical protein
MRNPQQADADSDTIRVAGRRAVLQPWAGDTGGNTGAVADALIGLMDLRLPLSVWIRAVVPGDGVALIAGGRHLAGTRPDQDRIQLSGAGATVVRRQQDGS